MFPSHSRHSLASLCWCQSIHAVTVYAMAHAEPGDRAVPSGAELDPKSSNEDPHHFEFDLDRGIQDQVLAKLKTSPMLELRKSVVIIYLANQGYGRPFIGVQQFDRPQTG